MVYSNGHLTIVEFQQWLNNCINDAKKRGLADADILYGFMVITAYLINMEQIRTLERKEQEKQEQKQ